MKTMVVVYWIDGEPGGGETKAVTAVGINGVDESHCTGGGFLQRALEIGQHGWLASLNQVCVIDGHVQAAYEKHVAYKSVISGIFFGLSLPPPCSPRDGT